jgi:diguanylate cyclase (GGDEF)-like protein
MMTPLDPRMDDLTGILTRKAFTDEFNQLMVNSQANETPLSLAFLDVDCFLEANNRYGHQGGDQILQAIAGNISELAGQQALVSRYGGDEFAVIFPGVERERAFLTLERIRAAVESLEIARGEGGETIRGITITAGLASFPLDGRTRAELIRKADQALYKAKALGRNAVRLAYEERMVTRTSHFTLTQLERLSKLASERSVGEAELLREALDDLLGKYGINDIER